MHYELPSQYYFIKTLDTNLINKLNKNSAFIYRNYTNKNFDNKKILLFKNSCKKKGIKFFISNNIKLAKNLCLDGAYIPSFNKNLSHLSYNFPRQFRILGSAHNLKEIRIKERQNVNAIFISSLFKQNKNLRGVFLISDLLNYFLF